MMMMKGSLFVAGVGAVQIQGDAAAPARVLGHGTAGGLQSVSEEDYQRIKGEVEQLIKEHPDKFRVPVRSHMEGPTAEGVTWRYGAPPDYTLANHSYLTGKMMAHKEGSLEQVVEDLVKTWEMERSHKVDHQTHQSVDQGHFRIGANNGKMFEHKEAHEIGNYNVLLDGCDQKLYDTSISNHESHEAFKDAFQTFPWEVLQVFSGPPVVGFSWRHWGDFVGQYKGNKGKGQRIEMYGFGTAEVNDKLQLKDVKIYYDANPFLKALNGQESSVATGPTSFFGSQEMPLVNRLDGGCPFNLPNTFKYDEGMRVKFQVPKEMSFASATNGTNTVTLAPGDKALIVKEVDDGKYLVKTDQNGAQVEIPGAYLRVASAM